MVAFQGIFTLAHDAIVGRVAVVVVVVVHALVPLLLGPETPEENGEGSDEDGSSDATHYTTDDALALVRETTSARAPAASESWLDGGLGVAGGA